MLWLVVAISTLVSSFAYAKPNSLSSQEILQNLVLDIAYEILPSEQLVKRDLQCSSCQHMLAAMKALPGRDISRALNSFRSRLSDMVHQITQTSVPSTVPFNFAEDFFNALSLMDPLGLDGQYMCHYFVNGACDLPATPFYNYTELLPAQQTKPNVPVSKNETFKVLHLSDVHLQLNYTLGSPVNCLGPMCCGADSVQDPMDSLLGAPLYGAYKCDTPESLLNSTLINVMDSEIPFDFALFTGDMVDHNPVFMDRDTCIAEEVQTMMDLKSFLGDIPVYSVLGNHDSFPFAQDAPDYSGFSQKFSFNLDLMSTLWLKNGWLNDTQVDQIKLHHGAYAKMVRPGLKVIAINTNFWYRWNLYNFAKSDQPDPSGMLKFLVDELYDCENSGTRAWIIGHVPPGGLPDDTMPVPSEYATAILERFHETIAGVFFGHTHRDEFTTLYANNATVISEETALLTAFMAPSITPFVDLNPGWRYYEIDADTFEVMDSVTFYSNLQDFTSVVDPNTELKWSLGYSARDLWGGDWPSGEPLNARFWHRLSHGILTDSAVAQTYSRMAIRSAPSDLVCNADCQKDQFCFTSSMSCTQAIACRDSAWRNPLFSQKTNQPFGVAGKSLLDMLQAQH